MAQKSLPSAVYWLASVLMCVETDFNRCFPPGSLLGILDDLKSALEDAFAKTDNTALQNNFLEYS
jgi:hypothetical protein